MKNIHNPSLTAYLPPKEKATGAAVVVVPGGGHRILVIDAEGTDAARFLNSIGVAAFVLKHRLGREEGSPYRVDVHASQDAYRALRLIRSRASEFGIDPTRLGMLGFSAGGEVVSMVAYPKGEGDATSVDPIDRLNGRPNFQMLVYPGPLGMPEVLPPDAPPAFFVTAIDDQSPARSILALLPKFRDAKIPAEAHIYAQGGHAFNMGQRSKLKTLQGWPQRMAEWLEDGGWLKR